MIKFFAMTILSVHVLSCLWITMAKIDEENNWLVGRFDEMSSLKIYIISFYFVTTTITTVGYGDISATNNNERIFAVVLLFVGVITFAYASG